MYFHLVPSLRNVQNRYPQLSKATDFAHFLRAGLSETKPHLKAFKILLKVCKSENKFMRSLLLPKYEQNILRISALASKERSNKKNKGTLLS